MTSSKIRLRNGLINNIVQFSPPVCATTYFISFCRENLIHIRVPNPSHNSNNKHILRSYKIYKFIIAFEIQYSNTQLGCTIEKV